MDTFKAVALAVVVALIGEPARAESFPTGDVFRPLVADPAEPRFFLSLLSVDRSSDRITIASIGGGINFGLYRWPGERAGEGWQVGIFGAVTSQFDMGSSSDDLINSDYRIGFPVSYKRGDFSARAKIFHLSSHLGDEVILNGTAPERVDLSYEAVDLVLAWQRGNWRPYGGGFYMLRSSLEGLKKSGLQAGIDYARPTPVLFGARLVGGLDNQVVRRNRLARRRQRQGRPGVRAAAAGAARSHAAARGLRRPGPVRPVLSPQHFLLRSRSAIRSMKKILVITLLVAGCATQGAHDYTQSEVRATQTVAYGTVESVRPVKIQADSAVVGTVAGAALGGLLGNQVGHGGGRAAATVIGAVAGGFAGNAVERHVNQEDGQEIVIRLESGSTIGIVQPGSQGFAAGQRVRVLTGPKGSRVEPA